jgi:hypothetical protein
MYFNTDMKAWAFSGIFQVEGQNFYVFSGREGRGWASKTPKMSKRFSNSFNVPINNSL